jgi:hypothetical protein
MTAHRAEHPQPKLRLALEQFQNPRLLHQQHLRGFQRARVGGIAGRRRQRRLGKRFSAAKDVDDLLLAGGVARWMFIAPRWMT